MKIVICTEKESFWYWFLDIFLLNYASTIKADCKIVKNIDTIVLFYKY